MTTSQSYYVIFITVLSRDHNGFKNNRDSQEQRKIIRTSKQELGSCTRYT